MKKKRRKREEKEEKKKIPIAGAAERERERREKREREREIERDFITSDESYYLNYFAFMISSRSPHLSSYAISSHVRSR